MVRLAKYIIVWVAGVCVWAGLMALFHPPVWGNLLASLVFGYGWGFVLVNEWYYQEEG